MSRPLDPRFLEDRLETYWEDRARQRFLGADRLEPDPQPWAVLLIAQAAAGKTVLRAALRSTLPGPRHVEIDPDELLYLHPAWPLANPGKNIDTHLVSRSGNPAGKKPCVTKAGGPAVEPLLAYVRRSAARLADRLLTAALRREASLIIECHSLSPQRVLPRLARLARRGYRLAVLVPAVPVRQSWQRRQAADANPARRETSRAEHEQQFARLLSLLERIEAEALVDRLNLCGWSSQHIVTFDRESGFRPGASREFFAGLPADTHARRGERSVQQPRAVRFRTSSEEAATPGNLPAESGESAEEATAGEERRRAGERRSWQAILRRCAAAERQGIPEHEDPRSNS